MARISKEHLNEIVERMQQSGFKIRSMAEEVGLRWSDVEDTIRFNATKEERRGQLLLNFLMLGASIGYMAAKGERLTPSETERGITKWTPDLN